MPKTLWPRRSPPRGATSGCHRHIASNTRVRPDAAGRCSLNREALPLSAQIHIIDKREWDPGYTKLCTGPEQLIDGLIALIGCCPDELVAKQTLLIDLPRDELKFVRAIGRAIRASLKASGRRSFADLKPAPDHRGYGALVQVADMIAGEIRQLGHGERPHLSALAWD